MRILALAVLVAFLAAGAHAQEHQLADPSQEARAIVLGDELRCVVCQSESINSSQAEMARDMRTLIREKIDEGWSDRKILDFARQRYGDFILLRPPVQANTYLLWALPALFFVSAVLCAVRIVRRKQKRRPALT